MRADRTGRTIALLLLGAGLFAASALIAGAPMGPPLPSWVASGCWGASITTLLLIVALVLRRLWNAAWVQGFVLYVVLPAVVLALLFTPCLVAGTMM